MPAQQLSLLAEKQQVLLLFAFQAFSKGCEKLMGKSLRALLHPEASNAISLPNKNKIIHASITGNEHCVFSPRLDWSRRIVWLASHHFLSSSGDKEVLTRPTKAVSLCSQWDLSASTCFIYELSKSEIKQKWDVIHILFYLIWSLCLYRYYWKKEGLLAKSAEMGLVTSLAWLCFLDNLENEWVGWIPPPNSCFFQDSWVIKEESKKLLYLTDSRIRSVEDCINQEDFLSLIQIYTIRIQHKSCWQ